jgi:hypothetical protein
VIGTTAIMQRIRGGLSDGNEFQHPTGVISMVAEDGDRSCKVK